MSDQNGIFFTKRQASILIATLIVLGLFMFMAGYFLGKKSDIDAMVEKTSQDVMADHAEYHSTMQSFVAQHGQLQDENQNSELEQGLASIPDALEELDKKENIQDEVKPVVKSTEEDASGTYSAALAGFGTKSAAIAMVQRLKRHGIEVAVKTKTSMSSRGKVVRYWYQVVTDSYVNRSDLESVIDSVIKLEHIKKTDIKITQQR